MPPSSFAIFKPKVPKLSSFNVLKRVDAAKEIRQISILLWHTKLIAFVGPRMVNGDFVHLAVVSRNEPDDRCEPKSQMLQLVRTSPFGMT